MRAFPQMRRLGHGLISFSKKNHQWIRILTPQVKQLRKATQPINWQKSYWKTESFNLVRVVVHYLGVLFLFSSCGISENLIDQESELCVSGDTLTSTTEAGDKTIISNEKLVEELQKNFDKPLKSYPLLDIGMIRYSKSGLVYRIDMDETFTGRVQKKDEKGMVQFQASFLNGVPHGLHLRRFDNGKLSMESIFDRGILTGIKKSWWSSGSLKEEEYWHNGTYRGRTTWDEEGRQIRTEWVRE